MGCSTTLTTSLRKIDDDEESNDICGGIPLLHEEVMKKIDQKIGSINRVVNNYDSNKYKSLEEFINYISKECVDKNLDGFSKAYLVYKWICSNIKCDVEKENKHEKIDDFPEEIYSRKKETISNFAKLYSHIMNNLNIKTIIVNGYVRGKEDKISWNIITVDNASYIIESFMGSGNIVNDTWKPEYTDYYFCPNPEEFIFSHFPDRNFPKYSLLPKDNNICKSKKDFDNLVKIKRNFFINNLTEIIPKTYNLETDDLNKVQIIVKYNRNYKNHELFCHVGIEGIKEVEKKICLSVKI